MAIVGASVVVLLLAWTFLLWRPKGDDLAEAKARTEAAELKATDLQVRLQRLQDASRRRPALEAQQQRLRSAVPDGPELAQLILDANSASTEAGVDFMSIAPARPGDATGGLPPSMTVDMAVEGSYFSVIDYLNKLLALPRIVVLDSIRVNPQAATHAPKLSVNLTARVFSQTPGPGGVAPIGPAAPASPAAAPASPVATPANAVPAPSAAAAPAAAAPLATPVVAR
jgi:Tfp pilus assembly protein PilO